MNKTSYVMLALLALAGCSTPSAALKQADDGVAVTAALDLELRAFRKAEALSEQFVLNSVGYQKTKVIALNRAIGGNDLALVATGDASTLLVISEADKYLKRLAQLDVVATTATTDATKGTAAVLAPLPSTSETLTDTQAKFASFGKELSKETRLKEFKVIYDAVKDTVDKNKKKVSEASAAAASAPIN